MPRCKLVQSGTLSAGAIGATHGEIGQTQFLPANVLKFGVDGDGNGRVDLIRSRPTRWPRPPTSCAAMAGAPAAAISPGRPITARCRAGTPPASTSRRSPSSAPRSTVAEVRHSVCSHGKSGSRDFRASLVLSVIEDRAAHNAANDGPALTPNGFTTTFGIQCCWPARAAVGWSVTWGCLGLVREGL